jgi:hypothetical protein
MDHHYSPSGSALRIDAGLVKAGAILVAGGSLLAFAGMAIASYALVSAGRRWTRQMDVPPREQAALKLRQAKHASRAGMEAWHSAAASYGNSSS